ncbi:MAG: metallophosphoesterase [Bacteroidota bacterium]
MPWPIYLHLVLAVPFLFLYWYVGTKLTNALVHGFQFLRRRVKKILFIIAAWLFCVPLLLLASYFIDRSWAVGVALGEIRVIDFLFIYPYWYGLVCTAQLGIAFLLTDLLKMFLFWLYRHSKERWLHLQGRIIIAFTVPMICYVLVKIISDTSSVRISIKEYTVPELPKSLDGFRIVHVSDIQVDDRTGGKIFDDAIQKVQVLQPDLTIFTGDLVTAGTKYIQQGARIIGKMNAKYGIYACLGNHDAWADAEQVTKHLRENGVIVLEDSVSRIHAGMSNIKLFGINNFYGRRAAHSIFSKQGTDSTDLQILITHSAVQWLVDSASQHRYNLFLSGHTHGGQIVLGLPWWPIIMSKIETPYVKGFYTVGSMLVSVTNGIGLTGAPFRFQAPAEISIIIIRCR